MSIDEDTREQKESDVKDKIRKSLERRFRPEFLNRLDEIIIFSTLSREVLEHIVEIQLSRTAKRMEGRGIDIAFTSELKKLIAGKGFDPHYGARPLKRAIQAQILDPLAQEIISGKIVNGDSILADVKNGKVEFLKNVKKLGGSGKRTTATAKA